MIPATYQPKAPFTVVGFKGGFQSWLAAVKCGKARYAAVVDANGVMICSPSGERSNGGPTR